MPGCGSRRSGSPKEQDHRNLASWPRCTHSEGDTRRATTEPPVPQERWRACRDTSGHEEDPAQQVRHLVRLPLGPLVPVYHTHRDRIRDVAADLDEPRPEHPAAGHHPGLSTGGCAGPWICPARTPSPTTACWRCSTSMNWAWWLPGTPPIPRPAGMLVTTMEYRHPVARARHQRRGGPGRPDGRGGRVLPGHRQAQARRLGCPRPAPDRRGRPAGPAWRPCPASRRGPARAGRPGRRPIRDLHRACQRRSQRPVLPVPAPLPGLRVLAAEIGGAADPDIAAPTRPSQPELRAYLGPGCSPSAERFAAAAPQLAGSWPGSTETADNPSRTDVRHIKTARQSRKAQLLTPEKATNHLPPHASTCTPTWP